MDFVIVVGLQFLTGLVIAAGALMGLFMGAFAVGAGFRAGMIMADWRLPVSLTTNHVLFVHLRNIGNAEMPQGLPGENTPPLDAKKH